MATSVRNEYAAHILTRYHRKLQKRMALPTIRRPPLRSGDRPLNIGILGAGAAGLYAALMLQWLIDHVSDSGITYEILEASADERHTGGRLNTRYFTDDPTSAPDDYYDAGAMRFPEIPFMDRVFGLFTYLGLEKDITPDPPLQTLIPYIMSAQDAEGNDLNIMFFNNKILTGAQFKAQEVAPLYDPFNTGVDLGNTYGTLINNKIGEFKERLAQGFTPENWDFLMQMDEYSTRSYMALTEPKYDDSVISYCETFDSATGLYDCALSESVMDSLDFDYPQEEVKWWCVHGGAEIISQRMANKLPKGLLVKGKRVTAISPVFSQADAPPHAVSVSVQGDGPREYAHVISTMPLSCLRAVDTSKCNLSYNMQVAMRSLHYDASVKVAIKFSKRWWEDPALPVGPQIGGVSSTDRPTRVVVYPSYGIGKTDATMIVSYTWAQDAMRFGALAQGKDSLEEAALLDIIFKDLADMHGIEDYTYLPNLKEAYDIIDWYGDQNSSGAFALFGPGQFKNLYPEVTKPAHGIIHFAGEATSVHHAWVLGSLNSAYRTVEEILHAEGKQHLMTLLNDNGWNFPLSNEVVPELLEQQVALGQHGY